MKTFLLSLLTTLFVTSCSLLDQRFADDVSVCTTGALISSSIRNSENPQQTQEAWIATRAVLKEFVVSGGQDSELLRMKLTQSLSKYFSPAVVTSIVSLVMEEIGESISDDTSLYRINKLILSIDTALIMLPQPILSNTK